MNGEIYITFADFVGRVKKNLSGQKQKTCSTGQELINRIVEGIVNRATLWGLSVRGEVTDRVAMEIILSAAVKAGIKGEYPYCLGQVIASVLEEDDIFQEVHSGVRVVIVPDPDGDSKWERILDELQWKKVA